MAIRYLYFYFMIIFTTTSVSLAQRILVNNPLNGQKLNVIWVILLYSNLVHMSKMNTLLISESLAGKEILKDWLDLQGVESFSII